MQKEREREREIIIYTDDTEGKLSSSIGRIQLKSYVQFWAPFF